MSFASRSVFSVPVCLVLGWIPALAGGGCTPSDVDAESSVSRSGRGFTVGSTATMTTRLTTDNTRASRLYTFATGTGRPIRAIVEDFNEEGARWSMVGRTADSADSAFILKSDDREVYGWVVYKDRNIAYEYTTDPEGKVVVEQVPVTKIFPVCNFPQQPDLDVLAFEEEGSVAAAPGTGMPAHIGTYPAGMDVTKLQSLPGAAKVWYINLTEVMNGGTPIGQTATDVWQTWQSLSATLSAFKVNVTTDPAVYAAAGVTNSGTASMKNVSEGTSSCGLNVFGTRTACTVNRYRNGYGTGRILAHEVGHGLGMLHDGGDNGGEYFNGFSAFQWTPLMGNIWPGDRWTQALYQWSKGEYTSATRKEDDFALLDRHLDFRDDDIPDVKPLVVEGTTVSAAANWGQIGKNTDTDSFSFRVAAGGGRANLKIDRIEYLGGAMLDVDASIVSASGMMAAQNNAAVARHAQLDVALEAGDYTLVIKGGAEGTPANGFSTYSSVGFYSISGTITGGSSTGAGGATGGGTGGATGAGGTTGAGGRAGATGSAGRAGTAGTTGTAGRAGTGGATGTGGSPGTGGGPGTGGTTASGGAPGTGGATGTGGTTVVATGGSVGTGGAVSGTGGATTSGSGGSGTTTPDAGAPATGDVATGCACRTGGDADSGALATALLGLAFVPWLRRRRSRG